MCVLKRRIFFIITECVSNVDENLAEMFLLDEEPSETQLHVSDDLYFL